MQYKTFICLFQSTRECSLSDDELFGAACVLLENNSHCHMYFTTVNFCDNKKLGTLQRHLIFAIFVNLQKSARVIFAISWIP